MASLTGSQVKAIIQGLHKSNVGGHFSLDITVRKILDAKYLWPNFFSRQCLVVPLMLQVPLDEQSDQVNIYKIGHSTTSRAIHEWRLDFIRPVVKTRRTECRYILVAIDYATKWVKGKALRSNSAKVTTNFLYKGILTRFGCPLHSVCDQESHSINSTIIHPIRAFLGSTYNIHSILLATKQAAKVNQEGDRLNVVEVGQRQPNRLGRPALHTIVCIQDC